MRVLVLSGGGSKGAFQLGVLTRLLGQPDAAPYDAIFGVSTGALTGTILAHGDTRAEQVEDLNRVIAVYMGLKSTDDIISAGGLLPKALSLLTKGGIFDPSPLKKLIDKNVFLPELRSSRTHLEIGYTDLNSGAYCTADSQNPEIKRFVLASASQPVFFRLDAPMADGGLRNMTPLGDAFRWIKAQQPTEPPAIDIIVCNPVEPLAYKAVNHKNALDVLTRTFDVMMNELYLSDLRRALKKNSKPDKDDLYADLRLYAPLQDLGAGLKFEPQPIRDMYQAGIDAQEHALTYAVL